MIKRQALLEILHAGELYEQLVKDIASCMAWIDMLDDQFARRQYVRSVFALVEALTYRIKQIVYGLYTQGDCALAPGEADLLAEVSYGIDSRGKVSRRGAKLRTVGNTRFALQMLAQHAAPGYVLNWNDNGWVSLQTALKVRHRLTHPKGLDDLNVSDKDLEVVKRGFEWYRVTLIGAFKHASELHRLQFENLTGLSVADETEHQ